MINVQNLPASFCIGHYIPKRYWPEEYCSFDHFVEFVRAVKVGDEDAIAWGVELIGQNLDGYEALVVVPSSTPDKRTSIEAIAQRLAKQEKRVDATPCLRRHTKVPAHYDNEPRTVETHLNSIELQQPELIQGKVVLLLDDVRTTGASFQACQQILEKASPKSVIPLALAQTWHPDEEENPIAELYQNLEEYIAEHYFQKHIELYEQFEIEREGLDVEQEHDDPDMWEYYADQHAEIDKTLKDEMQWLDIAEEQEQEAVDTLYSFAYGD
jgi:hypoxanthine phosphoribosyltransferase